jgi:glycosyltransferase involved in cell wall biosynthesis
MKASSNSTPGGIRIAYLGEFSPKKLGTGEDRLMALALGAQARGHQLTFFGRNPVHRTVAETLDRAGAVWRTLDELEENPLRTSRRLARNFDVIQLNNLAPRGKVAMATYAAWPAKVQFVDHVSGPSGGTVGRDSLPFRLLDRFTMARVHEAAGVSHYIEKRLQTRFGLSPDRTRTLYGGVDPERFRPDPSREPHQGLEALCVAHLIPDKGVDVLLRALPALTSPVWRLSVVGEGPQASELEALAGDLGVKGRVRFLGLRDDVDRLLQRSDVLVHPAVWQEALGYTVLEGMSSAVPVIASRVGGIPELIDDGQNGFLVPPGDPEAIAEKLNLLASDPGLRESLGEAARARVVDRFSLQRTVTHLLDWFEMSAGRRERTKPSSVEDGEHGRP